MENIFELLDRYKQANIALSLEQERDIIAKYIHSTNRLEGNSLTLAQTKSIIEEGVISGDNIKTKDLLEQRGTFKALKRMLKAVTNKEELSLKLIKELNWLTINSLYQDDYYFSYKEAGQVVGEFKAKNNRIQITLPSGRNDIIEPLSNFQNVELNMKMLIKRIENSEADVIKKASFLAQEIWLHQPFIDGNKRTARLLINFLTMKQGFPLFTYEDKGDYFNHMLINQYLNQKKGQIENFISNALKNRINEILQVNKRKRKGYRFFL